MLSSIKHLSSLHVFKLSPVPSFPGLVPNLSTTRKTGSYQYLTLVFDSEKCDKKKLLCDNFKKL